VLCHHPCMTGRGSIQLARVFGIRIAVDPSWFIVLFLLIYFLSAAYKDVFPGQDTQAFVLATASAVLFFTSVVLHELGHAVVAMRNGIGIAGIDLWLFGGLAKMKRDTDSAGVEFRVAVAGPIVSLAIVVLCVGAAQLVPGGGALDFGFGLHRASGLSPGEALLDWVGSFNAVLLIFNLLPGLPLDGGRIVRAAVWWRTGDRTRATRTAARLGRGVAYLIGGLGLASLLAGDSFGGVWLILIAFFLTQAARSAELQTQLTSRIEGLRVVDVMDDDPVAMPADTQIERALDEFFLRYGWPWFPVVDRAGRLLGLVTRQRADQVPDHLRGNWTVERVLSDEPTAALQVGVEDPLEAALGSEGLHRLGAAMAVDGEGVLRGILTVDQVRRAFQAPLAGA
jgi:Zn-dependent protease